MEPAEKNAVLPLTFPATDHEMAHADAHIYLPRGLSLDEAAHYWGLSPNSFKVEVKAGRAPKPLHFGRRRIWDKRALDQALDRLSKLTNDNKEGGWKDVGENALRRRKA